MAIVRVPLAEDGPIIPFLIGVSEPRRQMLLSLGQAVPDPIPIAALINTGAAGSVVDRQIIRRLGLQPRGVVQFKATRQGLAPESSLTYDIGLKLANVADGLLTAAAPVLEGSFAVPTYQAMLGRDLMTKVKLQYDGLSRAVTLQF